MSTLDSKYNNLAKKSRVKNLAPFSLRLTFEERAQLEAAAGDAPLGAYIRAILFDRELPKPRRARRKPVADHAALAKVLAALGGSRLSSNLNQMAKAVHTGSLPVNPDTEKDLQTACADIAAMRVALINALGLDGGAS